jgi:hypothetical protein
MAGFEVLIRELKEAGREIFWQGETSPKSVEELEGLLGASLPDSFRRFLVEYGGGGIVGEEISGIEDNDAALDSRGTVLGDTIRCRTDFGLPLGLIVIYLGEDDVVWCLDSKSFEGAECPVVSFDACSRMTRRLADTFDQFIADFLRLRSART